MSKKLRALRLTALLAAVCAITAPGDAAAQTQFELTGNARFQIGGGLPFPITGAPPPDGRVQAHGVALARQTTGPDPKRLSLASGQLTAPGNTINIGFFTFFQVQTNIQVQVPKGPAVFSAGGRTGAPVTTLAPSSVPGLIRYSATSNQFGGPAPARLAGSAVIAINAGGNNPAAGDCTNLTSNACTVVFARGIPPETGALGAPLGLSLQKIVPAPGPESGAILATVSPGGIIGSYVPLSLSGLPNTVTSVGGPWTIGRVTISQAAASPPEVFTITGSDGRVNGVGSLSLVAGSLSQRALSGPNANRGWLNLNVQPLPEPAATLGAAAAFAALLAAHALARRRP